MLLVLEKYEFAGMRVLIIEDMLDNPNLLAKRAANYKLKTVWPMKF
jgi:hypothetical protein